MLKARLLTKPRRLTKKSYKDLLNKFKSYFLPNAYTTNFYNISTADCRCSQLYRLVCIALL